MQEFYVAFLNNKPVCTWWHPFSAWPSYSTRDTDIVRR